MIFPVKSSNLNLQRQNKIWESSHMPSFISGYSEIFVYVSQISIYTLNLLYKLYIYYTTLYFVAQCTYTYIYIYSKIINDYFYLVIISSDEIT